MNPALVLDSVSAAYGPFRALFDVSLTVAAGEAVALVGPNGVGKTTVARVSSGLVAPTRGQVQVDGHNLAGAPVHRYVAAGVACAPEGRSVFDTLSVQDNLALSFRRSMGRRGVADALDRAFTLFPVLGERRRQAAGTLSGGQQRILSMARVVVEEPLLLVADELSLGLAPIVVDQVYEILSRLREQGTALLVVEQQLAHALTLCDRVVLLDHGRVTWAGPAERAGEVIAAKVFHDPEEAHASAPTPA